MNAIHAPLSRVSRGCTLRLALFCAAIGFASLSRAVAPPAGEPKINAAAGSTAAPPFDLADPVRIEAGRKRFNKTCAGYCHGFEGKGGRAPDFRGRTDLPAQTVFDTITNGRTGADVMPPWGGAFLEEQIWELVAYIRYLGTLPAE
jgi:mono/diheme cytochrome c family protein